MRSPSYAATALAVAAAMIGGAQDVPTDHALRLTPGMDSPNFFRHFHPRRPKGRVAQNQRQRRQDRRRAWAAGNRKAFNK